jgi:hypothetical protein
MNRGAFYKPILGGTTEQTRFQQFTAERVFKALGLGKIEKDKKYDKVDWVRGPDMHFRVGSEIFNDIGIRIGIMSLSGLKPPGWIEPYLGGIFPKSQTLIEGGKSVDTRASWRCLSSLLGNPGVLLESFLATIQPAVNQGSATFTYQFGPGIIDIIEGALLLAKSSVRDEWAKDDKAVFGAYLDPMVKKDDFCGNFVTWRKQLNLCKLGDDQSDLTIFNRLAEIAHQLAQVLQKVFKSASNPSFADRNLLDALMDLENEVNLLEEDDHRLGDDFLNKIVPLRIHGFKRGLCFLLYSVVPNYAGHFDEVLGNSRRLEGKLTVSNEVAACNIESIGHFLEGAVLYRRGQLLRELKERRERLEAENKISMAAQRAREVAEAARREQTRTENVAKIIKFFTDFQPAPLPASAMSVTDKDVSGITTNLRNEFLKHLEAILFIKNDILDYRGPSLEASQVSSIAADKIAELTASGRIYGDLKDTDLGDPTIERLSQLIFDPMNQGLVLSVGGFEAAKIKEYFGVKIPNTTPLDRPARALANLYSDRAAREAIDYIIDWQELNLFLATLLLPVGQVKSLKKNEQELKSAIRSALEVAANKDAQLERVKLKRVEAKAPVPSVDVDLSNLFDSVSELKLSWQTSVDGSIIFLIRNSDELVVELAVEDLNKPSKKLAKLFDAKVTEAQEERPARDSLKRLSDCGFVLEENNLLIHAESGLSLELNGELKSKERELLTLEGDFAGYIGKRQELADLLNASNAQIEAKGDGVFEIGPRSEDYSGDLDPLAIKLVDLGKLIEAAKEYGSTGTSTETTERLVFTPQSKRDRSRARYKADLQIKPGNNITFLDANTLLDLVKANHVHIRSDYGLTLLLSLWCKQPNHRIIIPYTVAFEALGWIPPDNLSPDDSEFIYSSPEKRRLIELILRHASICKLDSEGNFDPVTEQGERTPKFAVVFTDGDQDMRAKISNIWRGVGNTGDKTRSIKVLTAKGRGLNGTGGDLGERAITEVSNLIASRREVAECPVTIVTNDRLYKGKYMPSDALAMTNEQWAIKAASLNPGRLGLGVLPRHELATLVCQAIDAGRLPPPQG